MGGEQHNMSTKLEAAYKTQMVKDVITMGGWARRFEDQYTVGQPDCIFILPDRHPCFAEVKRFTGFKFGPTPRQYAELVRIQQSSTKVAACVIGITYGQFFIANPKLVIDINVDRTWTGATFIKALEAYLK